jgi:hypothetical protein
VSLSPGDGELGDTVDDEENNSHKDHHSASVVDPEPEKHKTGNHTYKYARGEQREHQLVGELLLLFSLPLLLSLNPLLCTLIRHALTVRRVRVDDLAFGELLPLKGEAVRKPARGVTPRLSSPDHLSSAQS